MERVYAAFQYQTADELQGYSISGDYSTYGGDGYVYEMRGQLSYIQGNLSLLQQLDWIDRQTRAVMVEYTLYNPNINMLIVAEILIELLPTGNILTYSRFEPLNLFNEINDSGTTLKIGIYCVYMVLIIYFMNIELYKMYRQGIRIYKKSFWNYIEWLLILFSALAFGLFFYRLSVAYQVLSFFSKTQGYGLVRIIFISTKFSSLSFSYCYRLNK